MKRLALIPISFIFAGLLTTISSASDFKSISGQDLLSSNDVAVSAENKKGLVVVFLSAKCPCSNSHIMEIKELSQKYSDFAFVAVHSNVDEDIEMSQTYFKQAELSFPVIQDRENETADRFKAFKTPHAFVVIPNDTIAYQGGVSNSKDIAKSDRKYLREALEDIQAGQVVRTKEGRTLGCAITRGKKNVR